MIEMESNTIVSRRPTTIATPEAIAVEDAEAACGPSWRFARNDVETNPRDFVGQTNIASILHGVGWGMNAVTMSVLSTCRPAIPGAGGSREVNSTPEAHTLVNLVSVRGMFDDIVLDAWGCKGYFGGGLVVGASRTVEPFGGVSLPATSRTFHAPIVTQCHGNCNADRQMAYRKRRIK